MKIIATMCMCNITQYLMHICTQEEGESPQHLMHICTQEEGESPKLSICVLS